MSQEGVGGCLSYKATCRLCHQLATVGGPVLKIGFSAASVRKASSGRAPPPHFPPFHPYADQTRNPPKEQGADQMRGRGVQEQTAGRQDLRGWKICRLRVVPQEGPSLEGKTQLRRHNLNPSRRQCRPTREYPSRGRLLPGCCCCCCCCKEGLGTPSDCRRQWGSSPGGTPQGQLTESGRVHGTWGTCGLRARFPAEGAAGVLGAP